MVLPSAMEGVIRENSLNVDVAILIAFLPGRLLQKIERELIKSKVRRRADKKPASRKMRRIISSYFLRQAETLNAPNPAQPLHAPPTEPTPPPAPPTPRAPASATAPELERKVARLETELKIRDRSRQKRNDAFKSLKLSEHTKMLQLMDANDQINRLEAELQKSKKKTVTWLHRAEKFKAERYRRFAPLLDQVPSIPPPRAIEWGILARQFEFWVGVVVFIMLLAVFYAVGKYLGNNAPAIPISCPRQIPCPRPPRIEKDWPDSFPIAECPPVKCPMVPDCPTGTDLPPAEKCRGNRDLLAAFAIGVLTGGFSTWQTVQAMD